MIKHGIAPTEEKKEIKNIEFKPTEQDKDLFRELQKDMEIIDEPFVQACKQILALLKMKYLQK